MALDALRCDHLASLGFKGLKGADVMVKIINGAVMCGPPLAWSQISNMHPCPKTGTVPNVHFPPGADEHQQ